MRGTRALLISAALSVLPAGPAAAETPRDGSSRLVAQSTGQSVACNEIEQRTIISQTQLNNRVITDFFFDAAGRGCLELMQRLLDLGAGIHARDRAGNTGLLIAAQGGKTQVVELLLALGSDVNHQNLAGSTALLRAVTKNRRRTAKKLLAAGAEVNRANRRGVSPLMAAAFNGNERLVRLLLEAGADTGGNDLTGKSAMVYAAVKGFAAITGRLLDAGVEVDARYGNELTALMWAAGYTNDVPAAEGLETVKLLLERGAAYDLADNRGRTALMIAAGRGHAEIVSHLLEIGADPKARDREGKTARDLTADDAVRSALGGS